MVFLVLALLIGIVLGGTQALSGPLQPAHPRGREAEFFSLYQAMERDELARHADLRSRLPVQPQLPVAIVALVVFFVVGGLLLAKVDMRRGIEAGNPLPVVV